MTLVINSSTFLLLHEINQRYGDSTIGQNFYKSLPVWIFTKKIKHATTIAFYNLSLFIIASILLEVISYLALI